jgi:amino acid transporter
MTTSTPPQLRPPRPPSPAARPQNRRTRPIASIVIGIASTAAAYSLAASVGLVSDEVGIKAPLIMILAFIPILFISYAYRTFNSRVLDCGTNVTWGARAFGPHVGRRSGWGAIIAQMIVLANLGQIAGIYSFKLVGADGRPTATVGAPWPARSGRS